MKNNWQKVKLGDPDVAVLIMGVSPSSKFYNNNEGVPFLQGSAQFGELYPVTDIFTSKAVKVAERGDVLISVRAPVGDLNIADKKYCIGRGLAAIRAKEKTDSKFLFYYLLVSRKKIQSESSGSTFKSINKSTLDKFEILLPPKPIQQKIVKILDGIREEIRKQQEITEKSRELKKSLIKKLLSKGTQGEKLKKTKIGELPISWKVAKLGEVCQKPQYGFTASSSQDQKLGPKFIRITDIQDDKIDWSNVPYCKCKKPDNYLLKNGDILVARIGATTGKTVLFNYDEEAVFASYLIRIRPDLEKLNPIFLNYFFQTNFYWDQINLQKGGRLKGGINVPVIQNLILQLPDIKEQKEIVVILEKVDNRIRAAQKQKRIYEELFNLMLNKIMNGRIDVEDISIK